MNWLGWVWGTLGWVVALGWMTAFFRGRRFDAKGGLTKAEVITKRVAMLRERGLELAEKGIQLHRDGYPATGDGMRQEAARMFAEADRLEPPEPVVDPTAEPGRLSLVKIKGE